LQREGNQLSLPSAFYFEKSFHHDWCAKWQAGNANHHSDRQLVLPEDIPQQFRASVSYLRVRNEVIPGSQIDSYLDDPGDPIERSHVGLTTESIEELRSYYYSLELPSAPS